MKSHPLLSELTEEEITNWLGIKVLDLKTWKEGDSQDVFLTEDLSAGEVIGEVVEKKIHHLVQKNEKRLKTDIQVAKSLVEKKADYFSDEFCFFTAERKILIPFVGASEKAILKEKLTAFVEVLGSELLSQCANSVFEELYMNAVIDAPQEAKKYNIVSSGKSPQFFLATCSDSLQISCSDYFGSLDTDKLLMRMNEVYAKGAGEVINMRGKGGAGLGCVILFENSLSLIIGVDTGNQTKVTCILPVGVSNRQREKMKKSLHWFRI